MGRRACRSARRDFIDLNLGCPIDHFTRKGLGARSRQPSRIRRIVEAMRGRERAGDGQLRLGWTDTNAITWISPARSSTGRRGDHPCTVERVKHGIAIGRVGRDCRSGAIGAVPVVGNGDLYRMRSIGRVPTAARRMIARRASSLDFREASTATGTSPRRRSDYRRYVVLAREHWATRARRNDAPVPPSYGRQRLREFLRWHVGFWCRYVPRHVDGTRPSMQRRESDFVARSPLEALLARHDDAALEYVTDELLNDGDFSHPPSLSTIAADTDLVEAG